MDHHTSPMSHREIQSFYGRFARLYDAFATVPLFSAWRSAAVDALDLSEGDTVVEMGCGTGANLRFLRESVGPEGRVVGVDLTRSMLEQARVHTVEYRNVQLVQGDASRPPIERADAVLGSFVVGLLPDAASAVEEWCAIADGRVALLDGAPSHHPVGRLLNPAFGTAVSLATPADSLSETIRDRPASAEARNQLDSAVQESRNTLVDSTTDRRYESFMLGFVGLLSGQTQ